MSANQGMSAAPAEPEEAWAPRLAQEARLRQLETLLASEGSRENVIALDIERAVLLAALNRHEEAKIAFIAILRNAPTHFSALNAFGAFLTEIGATEAACRVYAEAILHHPENPSGHVNLGNPLLRASQYEGAQQHYEAALRIDPEHAAAHQGLGAVLADLGERM